MINIHPGFVSFDLDQLLWGHFSTSYIQHRKFMMFMSYCWCFRNTVNSPVEGLVVLPIIYKGFSTIPGGDRRISEPSTVSSTFTKGLWGLCLSLEGCFKHHRGLSCFEMIRYVINCFRDFLKKSHHHYHPWSLTVRPWKRTIPIGKACLPTTIFQGRKC